MKKYIRLLRVKHWLKNGLIFLPSLCAGIIIEGGKLDNLIIAFLAFSFLSSAIYIINDIKDVEKDKLHEIKSKRPLANGDISLQSAIILCGTALCIAIFLNYITNSSAITWIIMAAYLILNIGYSFGLKNYPLVDLVILVSGYLARVLYGGLISDVPISSWLYLVIITFSFYLGLGKRRNEITVNGINARKSLKYYNKEFLDKNMYMCLGLTIMFYSMWTMDNKVASRNMNLIWSIPIVLLIVMRYSMIIEEPHSSGDPIDVLLSDKLLLVLVALYMVAFVLAIYI